MTDGFRITESGDLRITEASVFRITEKFYEAFSELQGSGSTDFQETLKARYYGEASLEGSSQVEAEGRVGIFGYANLTATGSKASIGVGILKGYFTSVSRGELSSSAIIKKYVSSDLQAVGSKASIGIRTAFGACNLLGEANKVSEGRRIQKGISALQGAGNLSAEAGIILFQGSCYVKVNGTWKLASIYAKSNSTWQQIIKANRKLNNLWKRVL